MAAEVFIAASKLDQISTFWRAPMKQHLNSIEI